MKIFRYATLLTILFLLISGCSSTSKTTIFEDRKYEYKKVHEIGKDLEVPPDLTKSSLGNNLILPRASRNDETSLASLADQEQTRNRVLGIGKGVLLDVEGIQLRRDGDQRWLELNSSPADVWPVVVAFWQENGILLVEQDPVLGVMSTDWIENRANIASDFITDKIRGVFDGLYGASTRDQYRIRLEKGSKPGSTELFLTHRGLEQEFVTGSSGETEEAVWKSRATDHDAEAVMLRRLMVYMGVAEQQATNLAGNDKSRMRSRMVKGDGKLQLVIDEKIKKSWRLVGVALDRVGFLVEGRNRDQRYYLVRYDDPLKNNEKKGMLSSLVFWSDDVEVDENTLYRIKLKEQGKSSLISIGNEKGQALTSKTAERLLNLIHEQIK